MGSSESWWDQHVRERKMARAAFVYGFLLGVAVTALLTLLLGR